MARLKPLNVAAIAIAAVMALVIFRGIATGGWIPWGAAIFIAITLGIVAASLVALLPGNGSDKQDKPASTPAISCRAASPSVAPAAGLVRQDLRAASGSHRARADRDCLPAADAAQPMIPGISAISAASRPCSRSFTWPPWTRRRRDRAASLRDADRLSPPAPASARHEAFPAQGVLYFFLDLRWGHPNGFRVLFADDPMDVRCRRRPTTGY